MSSESRRHIERFLNNVSVKPLYGKRLYSDISKIRGCEVYAYYTPLVVERTNAGYYIGRIYIEEDKNGRVITSYPGSRESAYYNSRSEAEAALNSGKFDLRLTEASMMMYETHGIIEKQLLQEGN
jgi:hypothetical protein